MFVYIEKKQYLCIVIIKEMVTTQSTVITGFFFLVDAKKELLRMYNDMYDGERPHACNWGMAVIHSAANVYGASPTYRDGTRSFSYDGRRYSIEEE